MESSSWSLGDIWFCILGLFLVLYVVLDGFDLGIGIISLFARSEQRRDMMMASLGSIWDANETWLVVFAGALFGAFPAVYGVVLHGLYIPISLMLFGLIFRGVAFEFRAHARHKQYWNYCFGVGSLLAASMQGVALGALIGGIPVEEMAFNGTAWHWWSPFAVLTAVGVVFGYMLLGATYLIMKTQDRLQQHARRVAEITAWLTVAISLIVSLWTPMRFDYIAQRWLEWPTLLYLAPLPIAAAGSFLMLLRAIDKGYEHTPFFWSVGIFVFAFVGLVASFYPFLIPPSVVITNVAASNKTLLFMLTGIGVLIPIMIFYNAFQYSVFKGKVKTDDYGD